ncbi:hypothetical protein PISMIDRAFT_371810 [Pisolithus microcarpus 441]|uniref:Uncharacterized protein n=1 Tax=Pisolithus microcarpus 441 TaxID=765257 RepID=A0A0C9XN11_9AGAM|nr:hypothetical protein PISMIDRAFT_371810 [Pisolithus microcarpus 441]
MQVTTAFDGAETKCLESYLQLDMADRLRQVWSSTNEAHYEATLSYSVAKNPQNTYMQVSCGLHSTRALPKAGNLLGRSLEGNHPRLTLSGKLVLRFHS